MTWQEIHRFDQDLTLLVNSWNSDFSDPIWEFLSDIPVWIPMYLLIVLYIIWRLGWKKGLIVVAGALLTFGFCDQFSNIINGTVNVVNDGDAPCSWELTVTALGTLENPCITKKATGEFLFIIYANICE